MQNSNKYKLKSKGNRNKIITIIGKPGNSKLWWKMVTLQIIATIFHPILVRVAVNIYLTWLSSLKTLKNKDKNNEWKKENWSVHWKTRLLFF